MMIAALLQNGLLAWWVLASPWMLLWALAAIVPVLIHLWSKRRYDEVPWAAMKFLLAAIRKNARRWRIEQLLLLAVRIFILVLLAIALADPVVSFLGDTGIMGTSRGDTHVVLVLDASYSMDYRQGDATRFDLAKGLASELVRQGEQGDGFTLIRLAAPPSVVVSDPVFDREDMVAEITQLQRTDGGANLEATLAEVERVLDHAIEREPRLQRRRVCIFTDMGRTTWEDVVGDAVQTTLARLAEKAELRLFDVGQSGGQNVAVTRLSTTEGVVTVGYPTRLDIELENFGNQDRLQQRVEVLVDGQNVSELREDIPAGGEATASAVHRFQMPGEHVVEVRLSEDRLEVDNHRWLSVTVRAAMEVLCVEGKSGSARNVALALEPASTQQSRVRPVVRSEIALLEEDLSRYDCVFLCNVGRFGRDEARLLRSYLERGGGVVVVLGDQVQPENYNSVLGVDAGALRCLPARLGEPVAPGQYLFDPLEYQHPIVAPFRGHERAGLLTTPIWKYVKLQCDAATHVAKVMAFQNGDPAILAESIGDGRVILLATDASSVSLDRSTEPPTPWSAFAAWPSFPPLIQQMLRSAVRGRTQLRNVIAGESLRGSMPAGSRETTVSIANPAAKRQRVSVKMDGNENQWTYTETSLSGVYGVFIQSETDRIDRYAVNLDTRESHLDRFDVELLPSQFRHETTADNTDTPSLLIPQPAHFFRYVLTVVLLLLICESLLAWFFGRAAA